MQQVTIGGVLATDDGEPVDASNELTRMFLLRNFRRLPFNCPTVDLRVHKHTPSDLLELAARVIATGVAVRIPILMNDDKLILCVAPRKRRAGRPEDARNYACDGCYETLVSW